MGNQVTIRFNNQNYNLIYNSQSGYYEIELKAPNEGGVYDIDITFKDLFEETYTEEATIQLFAKEPIKIEQNTIFMWIFDFYTFKVKDIIEIADYEINIDEETNANSFINIAKKTNISSNDIIAIKKDNELIYWGTVLDVQNVNGNNAYQITTRYITNLFDQNIILNPQIDTEIIPGGVGNYYNIISQIQATKYISFSNNNANINVGDNSYFWRITSTNNTDYFLQDRNTKKYLTASSLEFNSLFVEQDYAGTDNQKVKIEHINTTKYKLKMGEYYLTIDSETNNLKLYNDLGLDSRQIFIFEEADSLLIRDLGIEDFLALKINQNFIMNEDNFVNLNYLTVIAKTHTKKEVNVSNVTNNIFNLHTYMTNCTQNYNIVYKISINENKHLEISIELQDTKKQIIDVNAQNISNYLEVFETDIVSKVIVLTSTDTYELYLLNDRTTTTDRNNQNRAAGRTVVVYTEKYEDAAQTALNEIKANSYNHNITFSYNKFIAIGTPIGIKTKESIIYDTYISSIKITKNKFLNYICGNIRINFIEKIKKERKY